MSRVITFSTKFPSYHPKKGQPTFFVEKVLKSVSEWKKIIEHQMMPTIVNDFALSLEEPKHHTIRAGNRWKVGDKFSPRIWSDRPYNSPMVTFHPDIEIKKVWRFESDIEGLFYIDGKWIDVTSSDIPKNDGLSSDELLEWFPAGKIFKGQILCWNENINY